MFSLVRFHRMVLDLLKWLKETRFCKRKNIKTWTLHSTQEVGRKKKLARRFKKWKLYYSAKKKTKNDRIFSLAWNIVCWLLMSRCFEFFRWQKIRSFLRQKVDGNMILITEKFLFRTFREWEIRSFYETKS